jgi:hypothetical protein
VRLDRDAERNLVADRDALQGNLLEGTVVQRTRAGC